MARDIMTEMQPEYEIRDLEKPLEKVEDLVRLVPDADPREIDKAYGDAGQGMIEYSQIRDSLKAFGITAHQRDSELTRAVEGALNHALEGVQNSSPRELSPIALERYHALRSAVPGFVDVTKYDERLRNITGEKSDGGAGV